MRRRKIIMYYPRLVLVILGVVSSTAFGQESGEKPQGGPPAPVRVAPVIQQMVSDQITLVGTTEADDRSIVASEVSGLVEECTVREGDLVKKGEILVRLRSRDLELRLEAAVAAREKVRANLSFADKELDRYTRLKEAGSIEARKYDEAFYQHRSLQQQLLETEAEIDLLKDDIEKKTVKAPFSGFVAKEHTHVGEWLPVGGAVVTLVDLGHVKITVDVPERYAVHLRTQNGVRVVVGNISSEPFPGEISAILPEGDANARALPVHVRLSNPGFKIKGAMEAHVTFDLGTTKNALLVPKDAIVTAGTNRLVFVVASQVAQPAGVQVLGYYNGNVAIEGPVKPGDQVVIRGNERLRPGQPVQVIE